MRAAGPAAAGLDTAFKRRGLKRYPAKLACQSGRPVANQGPKYVANKPGRSGSISASTKIGLRACPPGALFAARPAVRSDSQLKFTPAWARGLGYTLQAPAPGTRRRRREEPAAAVGGLHAETEGPNRTPPSPRKLMLQAKGMGSDDGRTLLGCSRSIDRLIGLGLHGRGSERRVSRPTQHHTQSVAPVG